MGKWSENESLLLRGQQVDMWEPHGLHGALYVASRLRPFNVEATQLEGCPLSCLHCRSQH